ncbi:MAG: amidohydrolase family protein [Thermodesulforhabdaceae bacterium]
MWEKSPERSGASEMVDLILSHADYVVTCDNDRKVFADGAIAIKDGFIYDLGPSATIKDSYRAREFVELRGHILMPGLVNAHVHAAMSLFRGLADDLPLNTWLSEVIFPAEAKWINKDTVYLGSLLSFCEMLLSGITCFCDGYFFEEEVVRAASDCGIRGVAGQGVLDFPTPDVRDVALIFDRADKFLSSPGTAGNVRASLFCHSPYTCSEHTIRRTKELCRLYGALFQIHLAESEWERKEILDRTGKSPARYMYDLGVLDDKTLCVHGVWLDDEDVKILKDNGVALVHCLESNLKLASGIADVTRWMDTGLTVGLGTDGAASNNNLDILGEMSMVAKLHKGVKKDPTVCSALEVLHLGTLGGARAIGLGSETGSLEKGKRADCVALRTDVPNAVPVYDPVSHIVYSAKASDVAHVWVDGKAVVKNGRLTFVDQAELMKEVRKIADKIAIRPHFGR